MVSRLVYYVGKAVCECRLVLVYDFICLIVFSERGTEGYSAIHLRGLVLVRIKNLVVVIVTYQLVISLCVVYAAFFVWLIRRLVVLEGWVFNVVSGAIFVVLLVFNFRYVVPELKSYALGVSSGDKKSPSAAVYFDIVVGSMLSTFFIMMFVERFFLLEGAPYFAVMVVVFLVICVSFFVREKSSRSR